MTELVPIVSGGMKLVGNVLGKFLYQEILVGAWIVAAAGRSTVKFTFRNVWV